MPQEPRFGGHPGRPDARLIILRRVRPEYCVAPAYPDMSGGDVGRMTLEPICTDLTAITPGSDAVRMTK